ncbi:MAG: hypothetical protein ABIG39_01405, partial [Candidatus Micrarchaeota archaeon]
MQQLGRATPVSNFRQLPLSPMALFRKQLPSSFQPKLLMSIAGKRVSQGRLDDAVKLLNQILMVDPHDRFAISKLIQVRSRMGDMGGAKKLFDSSVSNVADKVIYVSMMVGHIDNGDLAGAYDIFERAVNAGYKDDDIFGTMLNACLKKGDTEHGSKVLYVAIHEGRDNESLYFSISSIYYSLQRFEDIESVLAKADFKDEGIFLKIMNLCYENGDADGARRVLDMAKRKGVKSVVLFRTTARLYYAEQRFEEAEKLLSNAPKRIR